MTQFLELGRKSSKPVQEAEMEFMVIVNCTHTFIAPLVAIALNEIPVRKVHKPQIATNNKDCPIPAIPTILQFHKRQRKQQRI